MEFASVSLEDVNINSRSAADYDAAHSVGEAVGEQAGDVIVHDLHLATLELSNLEQADLVLLWVLEDHTAVRETLCRTRWTERRQPGLLPCERA